MALTVIGVFAILAIYLGKRWSDASAENAELRALVTSLRRQLARRGG